MLFTPLLGGSVLLLDGASPPVWEDLPGETSTSYTTPPTTIGMNGCHYRFVATNVNGSVTSTAALLTVTASTLQRLKYWNGSAWITGSLKYWNGTDWVTGALKQWNGASWI